MERAVENELQVVQVIRIVAADHAGLREVVAIDFGGTLVYSDGVIEVAEHEPDVSRHVDQVAGSGHDSHKSLGAGDGALGRG